MVKWLYKLEPVYNLEALQASSKQIIMFRSHKVPFPLSLVKQIAFNCRLLWKVISVPDFMGFWPRFTIKSGSFSSRLIRTRAYHWSPLLEMMYRTSSPSFPSLTSRPFSSHRIEGPPGHLCEVAALYAGAARFFSERDYLRLSVGHLITFRRLTKY